MSVLIIFFAIISVIICLAKPKKKTTVFGIILAVLFFPLGVILSLEKRYK